MSERSEASAPASAAVIPFRAAWWAVFGLVVGELVGGILQSLAGSAVGGTSSAAATLAGEVGLWGGMLMSCVVVSRKYGTGSLRHDFSLRFRRRDIGLGLILALGATVVSAVYGDSFAGSRFAGTNTQLLTGQKSGFGFFLVALIVALGAPFFEELFFRGLIRTALSARLGRIGAVLVQGVLFGLAHYETSSGWGNVSVVVTIASVGVIFGLAAERAGRLGPGMIGHGGFNLVTTVYVLAS